METGQTTRVLVVANRTAATPWLLQEVERRAQAGRCEFALIVPPTGGRHPDWTLDVALALVEQAASRRVRTLECDRDCIAAVERALGEQHYDEVLVSTRPARRPNWIHHSLLRRLDRLGVPVTTVMLGQRARLDHGVLKVRWDDGAPQRVSRR
jgi:hypothetical protein